MPREGWRMSVVAIAMTAILALVLVGAYSWVIEPRTQTHAARELIKHSQLEPHIVKRGETWWGYARRINPGDIDPRAIVHELRVINRDAGYQSGPWLMEGERVLYP